MATILSLLFLYPFIKHKKQESLFLLIYVFFLLMCKQVRLILNDYGIDTLGANFFEFYSIAQYVMVAITILLLRGWIRILSITGFILFSLYNFSIYLWWGKVGLDLYDEIAICIIWLQAGIITFDDKFSFRILLMIIVTNIVAIGQGRYI